MNKICINIIEATFCVLLKLTGVASSITECRAMRKHTWLRAVIGETDVDMTWTRYLYSYHLLELQVL